jgi:radical SAM superfamily enzyme YgiQ (UPF0313 family)
MKKKILMVYPEIPATYWSYKYALHFVGYKTLMPPLGLITVAALLPADYEVKLVDMNIRKLSRDDVIEADMVFISAMIVQKESFQRVVDLCNDCGTPVAAGGPYPTTSHRSIHGVDYFILNEGEVTLPQFIRDLEEGHPKQIYLDETKPDITKTPPPRFELLDMASYATMSVQSSRGCPYNCEFCDIIEMFGRTPRYKLPEQLTNEMDRIYELGYRGPLFIVDDNFIGNKKMVRSLLKGIIAWQKERGHPFTIYTEASINLAHDESLIDLMVEAGFNMVFVGIETPIQETLALTQKQQNTKIDILDSVKKMQRKGLQVMGGFIVGFDNDPENIFDLQIEFIQKAGIPLAMIGTMVALPNTQLYRRLEREGRIIGDASGNNTHCMELNFIPKMPAATLLAGYKRVISTIYTPKHYFARCLTLLNRIPNRKSSNGPIMPSDVKAFILSLIKQTFSSYGIHYLRLLASALVHNPKNFPLAVNLAVKGYHFFKMTTNIIKVDEITVYMNSLIHKLEEQFSRYFTRKGSIDPVVITRLSAKAMNNIQRFYKRLSPEIKNYLKDSYQELKLRCEATANAWMQRAAAENGAILNES